MPALPIALLLLAAPAASTGGGVAGTGPWVQEAKLTAADGTVGAVFGASVDLAGDSALIGAGGADVGDNDVQGAAYVFTRSGGGWSQEAKLIAADGATGDEFGISVALDGDTALVGAYRADVSGNGDQGAAYVFTRSNGTWSQQAKLTAADGAGADFFGFSVSLAGDTALVGAFQADVDGNVNQGAAYVFTRDDGSWSQQAKFTATDGTELARFGYSTVLEGDMALVGAPLADVGGESDQGAAYVFTRGGGAWSEQAKLSAVGGANDVSAFGHSVALAGDSALVGAFGTNVDESVNQGAAYVFARSGDVWSQQGELIAADGAPFDNFGYSVALADDTALVGALDADLDGNPNQGAAYAFTRSGGVWSQQAKLTADDGAAQDGFGRSVALASEVGLVGAGLVDVEGTLDQGAVYAFVRTAPELSFDPASLDFGDVELGGSETRTATLSNSGDADATELSFQISGEGFESDTAACEPSLPAGGSCAIEVTFSPTQIGPYEGSLTVDSAEGAAAELALLGSGVSKSEVFTPVALAVDAVPILSDSNQVFEPGERVEVAPTWRNDGAFPQLLTGTAADFTGPDGPVYTLVLDAADYGEVEPGGTASCVDAEMCYQMDVGPPGVPRPATHWDATFEEILSDETVKPWALHIGDSFTDVPRASLFYRPVETLLHHGVSGDPSLARLQLPLLGCSETEFCPAAATTRAEAAVFLLKGLEGSGFDPQDCVSGSERFDDVPAEDPFCPWIEELAGRGVTAGCGGDDYCPDAAMTRAQMAVFLLKTAEGPDYVPPECSGVFDDVPCPSLFADWIEDLFVRGITTGCGGGNYCPNQPITRAQMAAFITRTFGLTLYGP